MRIYILQYTIYIVCTLYILIAIHNACAYVMFYSIERIYKNKTKPKAIIKREKKRMLLCNTIECVCVLCCVVCIYIYTLY